MPNKSVHTCQYQPRHGTPVLVSVTRPFVLSGLIFLLLMGVVGCSSGSGVRFADTVREGPVVILGDSLAAGHGVAEGEGFVDVLEARLGIPLVNLGLSGATTGESMTRLTEQVLPLRPALVILELGGNDALQRIDPVRTKENLATMIEQLQAESIPVMLLGVRGGIVKDKYADLFPELAATYQTGYVPDILGGILTSPGLKIDNVHPNAKGHQMVADRIEPELRRLCKATGKLD